jgi:starch synthase
MPSRPLRILMISAEVESFARTGGLGDVVESLSRVFADRGAEVVLVTPLYGVTRVPPRTVRWDAPVPVRVGWGAGDVRSAGVVEVEDVPRARGKLRVCLLDDPPLFARAGIYGNDHGTFDDNEYRFAALSRGALEIAARAWPDEGGPDVIHAHDWHAAFGILYAKLVMGDAWRARASVFTIHNLAFQGHLDPGALDRLGIPRDAYASGALNHFGSVNIMKGAIALADRVTTVSPSYAAEILTHERGFGLDGFLRDQRHKLFGVLNGIDTERFDPAADAAIARTYEGSTASAGKAANRHALAAENGLDGGDGPIFATVSRLTEQKGMDLFFDLVPHLVQRGARVVLVGQGEIALEARMQAVAARFPERVAVRIAFDPALARRVYAGADFFVVPSRYEPCGLTQMYAMRYGAIPIVTAVGGLKDTVVPIDAAHGTGWGVVASAPTREDLLVAFEDALAVFHDPVTRLGAITRAMARDSSWGPSADAYLALYESAIARL